MAKEHGHQIKKGYVSINTLETTNHVHDGTGVSLIHKEKNTDSIYKRNLIHSQEASHIMREPPMGWSSGTLGFAQPSI